jgi:hypothetical protein
VAAHRNVAQTPAELVDQSVMERADEDEVVEIAPAAISPPHDVVSLGEPRRTAAREPTLTVAVTDLPEKRRGRRALRSTGVEDAAGRIFDHGLDASVAEIAPNDLGMEHGPGLELGAVRAGGQTVGLGVDHDRRTIGVARGRGTCRAKRNQSVRASGGDVQVVLLPRHGGDRRCHPFDRLDDPRTLSDRKLRLQAHAGFVFQEPVAKEPPVVGFDVAIDVGTNLSVRATPHRADGDTLPPRDQPVLRLRRGEPAELEDLVESEHTRGEGLREPGETG